MYVIFPALDQGDVLGDLRNFLHPSSMFYDLWSSDSFLCPSWLYIKLLILLSLLWLLQQIQPHVLQICIPSGTLTIEHSPFTEHRIYLGEKQKEEKIKTM